MLACQRRWVRLGDAQVYGEVQCAGQQGLFRQGVCIQWSVQLLQCDVVDLMTGVASHCGKADRVGGQGASGMVTALAPTSGES